MVAGERDNVLSQAQEELLHARHVCRGVGIKDDNVRKSSFMLVTCAEGLESKTTTSSRFLVTRSRPVMTSLITVTTHPGAALLPCGMASQSMRRVGVQNAVRGVVSL